MDQIIYYTLAPFPCICDFHVYAIYMRSYSQRIFHGTIASLKSLVDVNVYVKAGSKHVQVAKENLQERSKLNRHVHFHSLMRELFVTCIHEPCSIQFEYSGHSELLLGKCTIKLDWSKISFF